MILTTGSGLTKTFDRRFDANEVFHPPPIVFGEIPLTEGGSETETIFRLGFDLPEFSMHRYSATPWPYLQSITGFRPFAGFESAIAIELFAPVNSCIGASFFS